MLSIVVLQFSKGRKDLQVFHLVCCLVVKCRVKLCLCEESLVLLRYQITNLTGTEKHEL